MSKLKVGQNGGFCRVRTYSFLKVCKPLFKKPSKSHCGIPRMCEDFVMK